MLKELMLAGGLSLLSLTAMAAEDWEVIADLKQIAATRDALNKPNLDFQTVTIVRLNDERGQRIDATSVGPTVVGFEPGGAPAAKTIMTFVRKPDRLVLFTQDVRARKAFRLEIPLDQLHAGRSIHFPVVQTSGELVEQVFTVQEIITR